ncbi:glutamate racemase [Lacticigenium naphthae]|uniref:glutamate racemase n=1 Tax=Lacticigenium naphthae TaxID=515351 RepID=UPI0004114683|nr:glutamate racemase [Lacticigenium naphthae]
MNNLPIGIIDSGVGGLTVLKEAIKQLPQESFYYLGDNARCPYGNRDKNEVIKYTVEMADYLMNKGIKLLIVACNTATAAALDILKKKLPIPVIGVIKPGSLAAIEKTKNKNIGVIGTKGTIDSGLYPFMLKAERDDLNISNLSCPEFVTLVENNEYKTDKAKKIVTKVLAPLESKNIDTLILGCTHYPLLKPFIQVALGSHVKLVDSGKETISDVKKVLDQMSLESTSNLNQNQIKLLTTGNLDSFKSIAEEWLNLHDINVEKVILGSIKGEESKENE